ncbi:hypothetical protein CF394_02715 [Tetzosporium hominis]|uniref:DUF309 domain-containing protein n=1 Tax=Tetzosporium hominis TaxID=2020506 RepID=A0A264W711_9BACL|nr:DUF309 domain-containing protein [Tetzosporium hominis]OZS79349.1 hypothetical protein CF394_02715 [Tetzosporium hominis]
MHLANHEAFQAYFYHYLVTEDYFECHEVLEELWKEVAPRDKSHLLVAFILVATSMYHWRRGNTKGATKSLTKALVLLEINASEVDSYVDSKKLEQQIQSKLIDISNEEAFSPVVFIVTSGTLAAAIEQFPEKQQVTDALIHRHTLRDRTEVIEARKQALHKRQR